MCQQPNEVCITSAYGYRQVPSHGSTKKPHPSVFLWDSQEAAEPLCLFRLWALCLTAPVMTGFCTGGSLSMRLNWHHQMVPVSYGLVSNGIKLADAVSFLGRIWISTKCAFAITCFSSLGKAISPFFANVCPWWGTVQCECAGKELQHGLKGTSEWSADISPRRKEPTVLSQDRGGQTPEQCLVLL